MLLLLCVLSAVFVAGVIGGFIAQDRTDMAAVALVVLALTVAAGLATAHRPAAVVCPLILGAGALHAWLADWQRLIAAGAPDHRSEQETEPRMLVFLWVAFGGGAFGAFVGFLVLGTSSLWIAAGAAMLLGLAAALHGGVRT